LTRVYNSELLLLMSLLLLQPGVPVQTKKRTPPAKNTNPLTFTQFVVLGFNEHLPQLHLLVSRWR